MGNMTFIAFFRNIWDNAGNQGLLSIIDTLVIFSMKHKLPIAIFVVAIAAAITGVISFRSGLFQTASIGELVRAVKASSVSSDVIIDLTSNDISPDMPIAAPGPQCDSSTKPWIKVLSPNGNETYTPGHKVIVKWVSCNIAPTDYVHVALLWKNSKNGTSGAVVQNATLNDVQETMTLPSDVGNGGSYLGGKLYKVQVVQSNNGNPNYDGAADTSDEAFTILNRVQ